jgi:glycosyltransferase involved in cell wall biosynthesis
MSLFFDKFIPVSKALEKYMVRYCRINPAKVTAVYAGIDLDKFNIRREKEEIDKLGEGFGLKKNDLVIGTVGRLEPRKGYRYLLESAVQVSKTYPQVKFLLVGDGELRDELEDLAKKLEITSKIIFAGLAQDVSSILSLLDIFVLPSLDEGLGIVILEAMAAGLPVIATDVGGIPEIVRDGETGLLVEPGNPSVLTSAITRLLGDKEYALTLGEAGKKYAGQFSSKVMVEKIEEIYDYCISRKVRN